MDAFYRNQPLPLKRCPAPLDGSRLRSFPKDNVWRIADLKGCSPKKQHYPEHSSFQTRTVHRPSVANDLLYEACDWVDGIPLSRPRKHLGRDFSDGVLLAEVIHYYKPHWIDLHNYTPANARSQKEHNWRLLNTRVLKRRFGIALEDNDIDDLVEGDKDAVERLLLDIKQRLEVPLAHVRTPARPLTDLDGRRYSHPNDRFTYLYPPNYPANRSVSTELLSRANNVLVHSSPSSSQSIYPSSSTRTNTVLRQGGRTLATPPRKRFEADQDTSELSPLSSMPMFPSDDGQETSLRGYSVKNETLYSPPVPSGSWESVLSPGEFTEWQALKATDTEFWTTPSHWMGPRGGQPTWMLGTGTSTDSQLQQKIDTLTEQLSLQQQKISSLEELLALKNLKITALTQRLSDDPLISSSKTLAA